MNNMIKSEKIFIMVPAYNEEKTLEYVLIDLLNRGYYVVLVDDGSKDNTFEIARNVQRNYSKKLFLHKHIINRGLGAAIKTGICAALNHGADYIVTFDADGQHNPEDIVNVIKPLINGEADVVIGSRVFSDMPLTRNFGNYLMNILTFIFHGLYVQDSQSGLRAFTRNATKKLNLRYRGYDISSEIIREIKSNNLKLSEIPITTIYTDETMNKGTNTRIGLKILFRMVLDLFKSR